MRVQRAEQRFFEKRGRADLCHVPFVSTAARERGKTIARLKHARTGDGKIICFHGPSLRPVSFPKDERNAAAG